MNDSVLCISHHRELDQRIPTSEMSAHPACRTASLHSVFSILKKSNNLCMPLIIIQSLTFSLPVGFSDVKRRRCPGTVNQPSRKQSSARLLSSSCLWPSSLVSPKWQRLTAHLSRSHSSMFECHAVTVSHLSHSLPDIACPRLTPTMFTQGAQIWL